MIRFFNLLLALSLSVNAWCCTSVIISGRVRPDGKALMLKHRDADEMHNEIRWFHGPSYSFIGLVNTPSPGGEVWGGTNTAGFSIMNTATFDLKDDDVPRTAMDKEGIFMYRALGLCATLHDFEHYLDTLSKPWGVEANFGIIDAQGGAAYYEVNNHKWTKFDVNAMPAGYRVVTNFTETGRMADRVGVERYEKTSAIMKGMDLSTVGHRDLIDRISRSAKPIERESTVSALLFEGVAPGEDPSRTIMWTLCGFPSSALCLPFTVRYHNTDITSLICSNALYVKNKTQLRGCPEVCRKIERSVEKKFNFGLSEREYAALVSSAVRKYINASLKIAESDKND